MVVLPAYLLLVTAEGWTAIGTFALAATGGAAALLAWGTLSQIKRQTDILAEEVRKMDAQTEAVRGQVALMREQWDEERAFRLDTAQSFDTDPSIRGPGTGSIYIPVWNHGRHLIRVRGFELTSPGGQGSVQLCDVPIPTEDRGHVDISGPFYSLVGGHAYNPDSDRLMNLSSTRFEANLHCIGPAGATVIPIQFQATFQGGPPSRIHLAFTPLQRSATAGGV